MKSIASQSLGAGAIKIKRKCARAGIKATIEDETNRVRTKPKKTWHSRWRRWWMKSIDGLRARLSLQGHLPPCLLFDGLSGLSRGSCGEIGTTAQQAKQPSVIAACRAHCPLDTTDGRCAACASAQRAQTSGTRKLMLARGEWGHRLGEV